MMIGFEERIMLLKLETRHCSMADGVLYVNVVSSRM